MKTISVVINKNWETEPFLNAFTSSLLKPATWPFPTMNDSPKDATNRMNTPRAVYYLRNANTITLKVVVWCIQDMMDPGKSSSSSEEKYRVLPKVLTADNPDLVIAVGTAGSTTDDSLNGCVVAGSQFFIHDGHPDNPDSKLQTKLFDKLQVSNVNPHVFGLLIKTGNDVAGKMITPPKNPAPALTCTGNVLNTALGTVNVTDYKEYKEADKKTLNAFEKEYRDVPIGSVETTHGIIKLSTDKPIMFFSGITDRLGYFDEEVTPLQNYIAAFNTGICVAHFLDSVNTQLFLDSSFSFGK